MRTRTMLAIGATTVGLTLAGAAAASAAPMANGFSPFQWAQHTMVGAGYGQDEDWAGGYGGATAGDGIGDPTECPYYDEATADQDQVRQRLHDQTGDGTFDRTRLRDRVDVDS